MIITLARNVQSGRFHPFAWCEAPLPSDSGNEGLVRHRSKFHHTAGFATEEEARAFLPSMKEDVIVMFGRATMRVDKVEEMTWAPDEVPAAVTWMEAE